MASLDGHSLVLVRTYAGLVGVLNRQSTISTELNLDGGTVVMAAGSRAVVAYIDAAEDADEALRVGYRLLQQALDVVSISDRVGLVFEDLIHQHLVWHRDSRRGLVARWAGCAQTIISTGVSWTVEHADGTTEQSPSPSRPAWAEAHRYFRKSQSGSSAIDAYRDMYLAMEQAMSFVHPHASGGEGAWTRQALKELINRGVQVGVYATSDPDPVEAFMDTFYAARNGHSHAKAGKRHVVPHDLEFHEEVLTDLTWLGQLTLHTFGVLGWDDGPFGGMVLGGVRVLNEAMDIRLAITEDTTLVHPDDTLPSPNGKPVSELTTVSLGPVDTAGFDFAWLGSAPVARLASTTVGRAIAGFPTSDSEGLSLFAVENPPALEIDGIDNFEYRFVHVHGAVFGRIRRHYPH